MAILMGGGYMKILIVVLFFVLCGCGVVQDEISGDTRIVRFGNLSPPIKAETIDKIKKEGWELSTSHGLTYIFRKAK
jgi:hypothetical protein